MKIKDILEKYPVGNIYIPPNAEVNNINFGNLDVYSLAVINDLFLWSYTTPNLSEKTLNSLKSQLENTKGRIEIALKILDSFKS